MQPRPFTNYSYFVIVQLLCLCTCLSVIMAEEEPLDSFTLISTSNEGTNAFIDKLNFGKEWIQERQSGENE